VFRNFVRRLSVRHPVIILPKSFARDEIKNEEDPILLKQWKCEKVTLRSRMFFSSRISIDNREFFQKIALLSTHVKCLYIELKIPLCSDGHAWKMLPSNLQQLTLQNEGFGGQFPFFDSSMKSLTHLTWTISNNFRIDFFQRIPSNITHLSLSYHFGIYLYLVCENTAYSLSHLKRLKSLILRCFDYSNIKTNAFPKSLRVLDLRNCYGSASLYPENVKHTRFGFDDDFHDRMPILEQSDDELNLDEDLPDLFDGDSDEQEVEEEGAVVGVKVQRKNKVKRRRWDRKKRKKEMKSMRRREKNRCRRSKSGRGGKKANFKNFRK